MREIVVFRGTELPNGAVTYNIDVEKESYLSGGGETFLDTYEGGGDQSPTGIREKEQSADDWPEY